MQDVAGRRGYKGQGNQLCQLPLNKEQERVTHASSFVAEKNPAFAGFRSPNDISDNDFLCGYTHNRTT